MICRYLPRYLSGIRVAPDIRPFLLSSIRPVIRLQIPDIRLQIPDIRLQIPDTGYPAKYQGFGGNKTQVFQIKFISSNGQNAIKY